LDLFGSGVFSNHSFFQKCLKFTFKKRKITH